MKPVTFLDWSSAEYLKKLRHLSLSKAIRLRLNKINHELEWTGISKDETRLRLLKEALQSAGRIPAISAIGEDNYKLLWDKVQEITRAGGWKQFQREYLLRRMSYEERS